MIYFRKIRFKNLLSYGNYFTEIDLDGGNLNIITATNGHGKCLHESTRLNVDFDNDETKKKFDRFLKNKYDN